MPASLSDIVTNRARLTHTLDNGESFTIDYRPAQLTPRQAHQATRAKALQGRAWESLSEAERDEALEAMDAITRMLASCLLATSLLDAEQRPIVCSYEGLQDVAYEHQAWMLDLIQQDQSLPKANGTGKSPVSSSGTLASPLTVTADISPRARNGTSSVRSRSGGN